MDKFEPEQFKSYEELPEEKKPEFAPVEGGFVKKEAMETIEDAGKIAAIANVLKDQGLKGEDVLHLEASDIDRAIKGAMSRIRSEKLEPEDVLTIFRRLPEEVKDSMSDDMILEIIKKSPEVLSRYPRGLGSDKDFVRKASMNNLNVLSYATEGVRDDKEFILEIMRFAKEQKEGRGRWHPLNVLDYLFGSKLMNDKEFILEAIKIDSGAFGYASVDITNDKDVVLEVVKLDPKAIELAGYRIRERVRNSME